MKITHKIKYLVNREWRIIIIIGTLILIGLAFWQLSTKTAEFGLNFFTEMLGVLVTVLIIDKIILIRENQRLIPLKMAVYEDVRLFTSRYIGFWTTTYRESVPENDPKDLAEFFSEKGISKIFLFLNMDSEPNVSPPIKWWDWMVHNAKEFKEKGDKILERHAHILEPEVYAKIHHITECDFTTLLNNIPLIRNYDITNNFPRPKTLNHYSIPPEKEDFEAILYLYQWCELTFNEYKKIKPNIKQVSQYAPIDNKKMPPKCQISMSILAKQIKEMDDFRKRK